MSNGFDATGPFAPPDFRIDPESRFRRDQRIRNRLEEEARRIARKRQAATAERAARQAFERKVAEGAARSRVFAQIARFGRLGGVVGTVAGIATEVAREILTKQERDIEDNLEAQNAAIQKKLDRRAKEKVLRTTGVQRASGRPDPAGEFRDRAAPERVLPVPGVRPPSDPFPAADPVVPRIPAPEPELTPGTPTPPRDPGERRRRQPGERPVRGPVSPVTGTPGLDPAPFPAPEPLTGPVSVPTPLPPLATPGFGVPEVFGVPGSPVPRPGTVPQFPVFQPVGLPRPPPRPVAPPVNLTDFNIDPLQFPVPEAQPQPDPARRCKPCKEDNPKPRDKCFKGLYRERRLDTEVDFVEWAEINCETGREL